MFTKETFFFFLNNPVFLLVTFYRGGLPQHRKRKKTCVGNYICKKLVMKLVLHDAALCARDEMEP